MHHDGFRHEEIAIIAHRIWEAKDLSQPTTKEVEIENWLEAEKIWEHHHHECKPRGVCDCGFDLSI